MPPHPQPVPAGPVRRLLGDPFAQTVLYLLGAALVMGFGLVRLWDVFSLLPAGEPPPPGAVAIPFVACLLVLLKRRAPLPGLAVACVLLVADLLTVGSIITLLVALELLHATTVGLGAAGRRRVLAGVVSATAAVAAAAWAVSRDPQVTVMIGMQFGALLGFSFWYANSIAQSGELVALYRQRAEDAARLADLGREAAVRGERERMARELHDVVAGHVAAVAIRSEAALAGPRPGAPESAERAALRAVRDASLAAHGELRAMIALLRDGGPGAPGTALSLGRESVPRLVAEANGSGLEASWLDEVEGEIATATDHAIGRIVQEALANAARHASGARVDVRLTGDERSVAVEVVSRGGAPLAGAALPGNGMGLELLAERASAVGGRLAAGPEPDPEDPSRAVWAVRAGLPRGAAA